MTSPRDSGDVEEVYLDHAASAPLRPEAAQAWTDAAAVHHANPTGAHRAARAARRALDDARDAVAAALGCDAAEVVFTSGGTEADNLAIRGVVAARGGRALCATTEHHAVLDPVLAVGGTTVPVEPDGRVDPDRLARTLDEVSGVSVVSVMAVNNETGVINDLAGIAEVVRRHAPEAVLHTDAVQAVQWGDVAEWTAEYDLVSVTGHKVGGPVGQGALVARKRVDFMPQISGGGQEAGRRAGTPAVALAAAFAAALGATVAGRSDDVPRIRAQRDRLLDGLAAAFDDQMLVTAAPAGDRVHLCAGIAHLCLTGIDAEAVLFLLDAQGLRASSASSCSSGAQQISHVLEAMGVDTEWARGSLRLSLGPTTTDADIDRALEIIPAAVTRLREFDGG